MSKLKWHSHFSFDRVKDRITAFFAREEGQALPIALATGAGSELMVPMAVAVIGGVTLSTFLTLFVVPCFYELMSRFEGHAHDAELKEALKLLGEMPAEPIS